jgi:hypothetical protein
MKRIVIGLVCLLLVIPFAVGCNRQFSSDNAQAAERDNSASSQPAGASGKLPFAESATRNSIEPSRSLLPEVPAVPAGTVISVRLQNSLSSATAHSGDTFDAVLDDPLVVDGRTIAARGAAARGHVVAARRSGHLHNSGYLRITLTSVEVEGRSVPVQTSSIFVAGGSHKNRDLALIGGGAGAGTLIGALAGGGKGALIGGLVGAGAGTGTAYATGKKDVGFAVERRLSFRLTQPAGIQR